MPSVEKPLGSPVTAIFVANVEEVKAATLVNKDTGENISVIIIHSTTDINERDFNGVVLVPNEPLNFASNYTAAVQVKYEGDEALKDVSWSFKTRE